MLALITGGGSGIGLEIARILYESYDLILVGRNVNRLEDGRASILDSYQSKARKNTIETISCDVSKPGDCQKLYDKLQNREIDVLINAAGFGTIGNFLETDLSKEVEETETNCIGLMCMMKLFLPDMLKRRSGSILNVASSAGYMPGSPGMAVYYGTKAYALSLTRSIATEYSCKKKGVYIGALCPGQVLTDFSTKAGGQVKKGLGAITAEQCAREALRGMARKKKVIIPGALMKLSYPFTKILPGNLLLYFARKHQEKKTKL
ncbi:MAG: SDR family oxidoreductase [Lachnospiraceae bacterium]|nr:SDR family oxidoreductase [Lachnospiraceae bacterium]